MVAVGGRGACGGRVAYVGFGVACGAVVGVVCGGCGARGQRRLWHSLRRLCRAVAVVAPYTLAGFFVGSIFQGKGEKSRGVLLTLLPSVSQIKSYQSNSPSYKGYADNSLFHFLLLPIFQFLASNY